MANYRMAGRLLTDPTGAVHLPVGVHYVPRSGPDWPWRTGAAEFAEAFRAIAAAGLDAVRFDIIWAAVEPEPGRYDAAHLAELDRILEAAARSGLSVHPTLFVGGEVGDAYWDLPWARNRNPHRDAELLELQAAQAAMLARRWRGHEALLAWDLTDEPPFWIYSDQTGDDDARVWTRTIVEAIRSEDPERLITIGTASQEVDHGPFRADVVADLLDFACVHPYPIYSPELYPDRLRARRMTQSAAFETALARGAGREVMVHEFGASSTQYAPEAVRDYDRLLVGTSFAAGAIGYYAWCWTDAETAAYRRAPYSRMPHETQFGLVDRDGAERPRLAALRRFREQLGGLDLDGLIAHGPRLDAVLPVPREFAAPYDESGYELGVPSPYTPAERIWDPQRSVTPLIRGLLNGHVLAARAGLSVAFPREGGEFPAAGVILVPAPLSSTTQSLLHLRPDFWPAAAERVAEGAVLYLSLSAETAIPDLADLAGVEIVDRAPVADLLELHGESELGGLASGEPIRIRDGHDAHHLRGVELDLRGAEVLARSGDGRPVLTVARRGRGAVVVCAHPIELLLAAVPDAHGPADGSHRIYRAIAELAGITRPHHPETSRGDLSGPRGALTVLANHAAEPLEVEVMDPSGGGRPVTLALEPYGVRWHAWPA
ncbi:MAG: cellulase family glycosylhydrolase [Actinomycetales bacterium]|nr:cellulase family glycosylhydrolase [Actinomycetales bacterium]